MKLAKIQSLFQASVLDEAPGAAFLAQLRPPTRAEKIEDVFAVYHDGYRLRLAEFLGNDYPVLHEALGDEAFGAIAEAYIAACPSRYRNARWFGAALPDFLRRTPPFSEDKIACGLASLEAALAQAFDAAEASVLPVDILGVTPQEDWPRLCFGFHPSVVLVDAPAAALACYEDIQAGADEPSPAGDDDTAVLVWRQGLEVNYRALDDIESLALREASRGAPFAEICALLSFARPTEPVENLTMTAAHFLGRWFSDGLIVAAEARPD